MPLLSYHIDEHIHRFGVWTAARAASKSRLSNNEVSLLIEIIGLRQKVETLRTVNPLTEAYYNVWIKEMGTRMIDAVNTIELKKTKTENYKKDNFSFGLAAKIISIYIKTVEVLPTKGKSVLSHVAYPPIDSILLKKLIADKGLDIKYQWSTFNWEEYNKTIKAIIFSFGDIPMWQIEDNWII